MTGLQQRHVERIAYSNFDLQLGRGLSLDAEENLVAIIEQGRSGCCFNANSAFALVLQTLGYRLALHPSWLEGSSANRVPKSVKSPFPLPEAGIFAEKHPNHVAMIVHGLSTAQNPNGRWWVDVGLGDGPLQPLPLVPGTYRQTPFDYRLEESSLFPGGWRFSNAPNAESFPVCDIHPDAAASFHDFDGVHEYLSTHPEAGFVRNFAIIRRFDGGIEKMIACDFTRIDEYGSSTVEIDNEQEWFGILDERFAVSSEDVAPEARSAL